jgi:hypothetical protein
MKKLIDPYAIFDTWLEFHDEDAYDTYLKCEIWHTDGKEVELISSYKECPGSMEMNNGNWSILWMFPDKYTEDNPPPLPNQVDLAKGCSDCPCADIYLEIAKREEAERLYWAKRRAAANIPINAPGDKIVGEEYIVERRNPDKTQSF